MFKVYDDLLEWNSLQQTRIITPSESKVHYSQRPSCESHLTIREIKLPFALKLFIIHARYGFQFGECGEELETP